MKNILKFLSLFLLSAAFLSCEDESTQRIPTDDLEKGPNVRISLDQDFLFINFGDLSTAKAKFDVFSESTNLELVEIRAFHTSVNGTISDTVTMKSYTQSDFNSSGGVFRNEEITVQSLVDAFELPGGLNDIQGGDSFTFMNRTTMTNGTVYPSETVNGNSNVNPNILNASGTTSFTSGWTLYVGCASDVVEFEGEYTSEIVAGNYFTGETNDVTISFKGPEPFRYTISDISAKAYVPFGGTEYPGDFYDICGSPLALVTNTFGATSDTGGGTWDPVNGVLTLNYFESFNGLSWTIVFTKK